MTDGFDQIVIAVPDLHSAGEAYSALLGCAPIESSGPARQCYFALTNTVLTLRQCTVESARIEGLVLRNAGAGREVQPLANSLGLAIGVCNGSDSDQLPRASGLAVDHLVLRTGDADACVAFFAEQQGIRLALDKTVPAWGGRMLFFRAGKMTLEVIQSDDAAPGENYFWGIALQHRDIDLLGTELRARGVELSAVRAGRKPGTRVATIKSHDLGVPTLLIEPDSG